MLKNTFCHLAGVGLRTEQGLWEAGIHTWEHILEAGARHPRLAQGAERSFRELAKRNAHFFAAGMPGNQHWRLFPDFRNAIAYLDIETTGLYFDDSITTIALYDGRSVFHFVRGQNLQDFKKRICDYDLIVTYNGKCFDVPFIERALGTSLDLVHIDLRYVLKSLGYSGGLKGCERSLGISRKGLEEVDGFFAVLLWNEYERAGDERVLETLLAYNVQDVLNLEKLLILAYNKKLRETPFEKSHQLEMTAGVPNPFSPDAATIRKIRARYQATWWH